MAARVTSCLSESLSVLRISTTKPMTSSRIFSRSMATQSSASSSKTPIIGETPQEIVQSWVPITTVPLTIHSFPHFEPVSLERWSVHHLYMPLRSDILHNAVIYEGDKTRQGTASSKTRFEVHGSHRKVRPQKGTGRARLGSKQSPLLRGGGKTFGPHPRDFSTKLNRKVYDKAWRIALSYRYRRGELYVCEDGMDLPLPADFGAAAPHFADTLGPKDAALLRNNYLAKYTTGVLTALKFGRRNGRTLFVTKDRRSSLFEALGLIPSEGRALDLPDVDVKDLLEMGQIVMERSVLREMIEQHQSDLVTRIVVGGLSTKVPEYPIGKKVLGV